MNVFDDRRIMWVLAVFMVGLLAAAPASANFWDWITGGSGEVDTITIGAIVPASGPNAEWGRKNRIALNMLEERVNEEGGVKGHDVEINVYDSHQDPSEAASLVRKIATDDMAYGISGPLTSSECEVAFPIANEQGIVTISQASSKPGVAAENRPWAFRNTYSEGKMANQAIQTWKDRYDIEDVAIAYDHADAVSTAIGTAVYPAMLEENDINVVNEDDMITFGTEAIDLSAQVTSLKNMDVDGIVIGADYGAASVMLREMNRQDMTTPVIGGTPLISQTIIEAAGDIPTMAPSTFHLGIDRPEVQQFIEEFRDRAEEAGLERTAPTMYDVNSWDNAKMIIDAIRNTDVELTPESIEEDRELVRDYVSGLTGDTFEGLSGFQEFNEDGDGVKDVYILLTGGDRDSWECLNC